MSESTISIPSLLVLAGISFLLYRYFYVGASAAAGGRQGPFSSSSSTTGAGGRGAGRRIDPAAVEQVAAVFPQLDRRAIAWDLQRNNGNPQATIERVLTTDRLEPPPPSFQPPGLPLARPAPAASTGSTGSAAKAKSHPDLITRYNLFTKIQTEQSAEEAEEEDEEKRKAKAAAAAAAEKGKGKASGWSANKNERAAIMQQRKEQMILQARQRMEDQDRRNKKGKAVEKS